MNQNLSIAFSEEQFNKVKLAARCYKEIVGEIPVRDNLRRISYKLSFNEYNKVLVSEFGLKDSLPYMINLEGVDDLKSEAESIIVNTYSNYYCKDKLDPIINCKIFSDKLIKSIFNSKNDLIKAINIEVNKIDSNLRGLA